ncbi:MAG: ATP-binding protein [Thermodesulfobacteriota bacterium]
MPYGEKELQKLFLRIKDGGTVENKKLELKSKWYDLKDADQRMNFCRDVSAIANTIGLEGYLIIGINEKNGAITNSPFKESGLNDKSEISGLLRKYVNPEPDCEIEEVELAYNNEKNILSVIKIPNTKNKPYVVGKYKYCQNYIPVRKDGSINSASRLDLDEMYAERKGLELEYDIEVHKISNEPIFNQIGQHEQFFRLSLDFSIHNKGSRAIAINKVSLSSDTDILTVNNMNYWTGKRHRKLSSDQQKSEMEFRFIPLEIEVGKRPIVRIDFDSQSFDLSSNRHLRENQLGKLLHELRRNSNYKFTVVFNTIEGQSFQHNFSFGSDA